MSTNIISAIVNGHVLAAEHGSEITARKMLDEISQSILSRYDLCSRSMSLSLKYGQEPVLRLLSQCNGQIHAAFTFAAIHGYDSGVRLLLTRGWQPDPIFSRSVASFSHTSLVRLLMEAQPDPGEGPDQFSPFIDALQMGNFEVAQYFLHAGADPN